MKAFLLVCALLLLPASAQAEGGWPTHLAVGTYMTLQGVDLATSMYLFGAQRAREANPVLAPFADQPVAFGAIKMGTAAVTSYLILRTHTQHPKLAFWLAMAGSIITAEVVANNRRLLGTMQ